MMLKDRIAVVTGASAGIGRAMARRFASEGARVVVNARRADRLDALVGEIVSDGGAAVAVSGDAASNETIASMLDAAKATWGAPVDLAVANAGRGLSGSPLTSDEGQWEEVIRTNFLGAMRFCRAAAGAMLESLETDDWTRTPRDLVVISSSVGRNVSPFSSMYGATKFAITSIAEAMRREIGPKGVRVTAIHPAVVESEFQGVAGYDAAQFGSFMESIGPVLQPEDIADLIAFAASRPAHVNLNDIMIRPTRQDYP
ncbi:SDR family oxidoreductase [Pyruvatibacter sp.]|uniref:SDR family oxidoreductase n=1 Tax=Pyruvatibacter sp. TaxID=1981328 RepID=UPI0032ED5382